MTGPPSTSDSRPAGSAQRPGPPARRLAWVLLLAALTAVALFAVTETTYRQSREAMENLNSRDAARTAIQTVMRRLLDAETAERGYMLTGRPEYLAPYRDAAADIGVAIARLQSFHAADRALLPTVQLLAMRVLEKQSEMSETLRIYARGDAEGARDLMLTDIGREKMDGVRRAAESLLAAEDRQVAGDRGSVYATLATSRLALHAMTAIGLVALIFFLRQTRALDRAQRRHAEALKAERDELDTQVRLRTTELTELAQHLQNAREDERSHLARELHDELGALLTAAKLNVARVKRALGDISPEMDQRVKHLNTTLDQGIALKRRIIEDLRPSSLNNLGLQAALQIQAREFGQQSGLAVTSEIDELQLSDAAQITLYRVVQESLTNIAKYASATRVSVSLRAAGDRARLAVQDDGCGFEPQQVARRSHGLVGMRYRVETGGGELRVVSAPGQGTRIEAWLPLPAQGPAAAEDVPVQAQASAEAKPEPASATAPEAVVARSDAP